jgi:hypothetical protein
LGRRAAFALIIRGNYQGKKALRRFFDAKSRFFARQSAPLAVLFSAFSLADRTSVSLAATVLLSGQARHESTVGRYVVNIY